MNPIQYKTNKVSKKRVYYEGSDTLLEGYLLCYNYDTTTDMDGDTVADGSQNSGRFLKVEKPTTANAPFFAGIVAKESGNVTGPCWITIIEPSVMTDIPVYSDVNCTNATTYLYIANGSYYARSTGVVALGLANETIDRSGTNGLVFCRIKINEPTSATVSDSLLSVETTLKSDIVAAISSATADLESDEKVLSDAIAVVSTRLYSDIIAVKSDVTAAISSATADLNSDEVVLSDAIAVVSTRLYSDIIAVKSDVTAAISSATADLNSDEVVLSDAIAVVSTRLYSDVIALKSDDTVINSEDTVVASAAKTLGSDAKTAASNIAVMWSDDINYSNADPSVFYSDIRIIYTKQISDMCVAMSNFAVRVSDKLT